jgi:hypothetical protein
MILSDAALVLASRPNKPGLGLAAFFDFFLGDPSGEDDLGEQRVRQLHHLDGAGRAQHGFEVDITDRFF